MKKIVVPGDEISGGKTFKGEVYKENGKTYAAVVGLAEDERMIALKGKYLPQLEDIVVGFVEDENFGRYAVDINSPYEGTISGRMTRIRLRIGDIISAKVSSVDEVHNTELIEPRRLWGGRLIEVEHVKVPRIIGKKGSMLKMLEEYTNCSIIVGKNGRIYLRGGNIPLAVMAILKICKEAHTSGLTDRIKKMLEKGELNEKA